MILTETVEHEELILANFWQRLGAWIIDTCLLFLVLLIARPFPSNIEIGFNADAILWIIGIWLIISAFYFVIFWTTLGQTIGSLLMDIKIIRRDNRALSFQLCLWRFIVYVTALLPLGYGLWSMIFDRYYRTWADHVAKTVVIRTPKMKKEQTNMPTIA